MMKNSIIKDHLKHIYKAFRYYNKVGLYLWVRYIIAPRILAWPHSLEKGKKRDDMSMHIFFGERDFVMALWSLASFYRVMPQVGQLFIHSDGTLNETHRKKINILFPNARIEDSKHFMREHPEILNEYPVLKKFRETYKKFQVRIIDYYFLSDKKYRLFIDSDLLWFKTPSEIVESLEQGIPKPLMMSNGEFVRMEFADGSFTDDRTSLPNDGILLTRQDQLDPKRMELFLNKCDYIGKRFGDQAWMSWVLDYDLLPVGTYIIKGTLTDQIVVRHYTSPSRTKFFIYGLDRMWDKILA